MRKPPTGASELWRVPVRVEDVPDSGAHFELSANAGVRDAIAAAAGLVGLPRFDAIFDVTRHGRSGAQVAGRISAVVDQTCVVTLEPLTNMIDEAVQVTFMPVSEVPAAPGDAVVPEGDDPPDALVDGTIDLGAVAIEFLLLAIDPYPRKPGAVFEAAHGDATREERSHPFATLVALKTKKPEGQ